MRFISRIFSSTDAVTDRRTGLPAFGHASTLGTPPPRAVSEKRVHSEIEEFPIPRENPGISPEPCAGGSPTGPSIVEKGLRGASRGPPLERAKIDPPDVTLEKTRVFGDEVRTPLALELAFDS